MELAFLESNPNGFKNPAAADVAIAVAAPNLAASSPTPATDAAAFVAAGDMAEAALEAFSRIEESIATCLVAA